ncbi:DUF3556 domain-containing protein [Streptomyces sp. NPDC001663]|uniref:DUF3556 domain-containing protein n=1 Tax=Streptomyces sp. NPDC001663 TaxID=3364597 RepID=UPI0036C35840
MLWTVLLEVVGVAGSWGPLAGKFKPMTGGILFWVQPGRIPLRPWRRVPFTNGDTRTVLDVALYLALLGCLAAAIALPGDDVSGLVEPALPIPVMTLLVLCGLRDNTLFLAVRGGEQYLPAMYFFAFLPFTDMIVALKLLIVVVWIGAGVSKMGLRFSNVVAPMVSNSPCVPARWFKRAHYRDFPRDVRPSKTASSHGACGRHVGGDLQPAGPAVLHRPGGDAGGRRADGGLPSVHHHDLPASGTA